MADLDEWAAGRPVIHEEIGHHEICQDVLARETDVYTGDYSSAVAIDHSDLTARAALTRVTGVIVKWSGTG